MLTKQAVMNEAAAICAAEAKRIASISDGDRKDIGMIMAAMAERCAELISNSITVTGANVMFPQDVLFRVNAVVRNKGDVDKLIEELERRKAALEDFQLSEEDKAAVAEMREVVAEFG